MARLNIHDVPGLVRCGFRGSRQRAIGSIFRKPSVDPYQTDLPEKDGCGSSGKDQGGQADQGIEVIVLTVSERSSDMTECRRLGVESYIVKPLC